MCENLVDFYVPHGYDYRKVSVKCGFTDPHGNRAICGECRKDPMEMDSIRKHSGLLLNL